MELSISVTMGILSFGSRVLLLVGTEKSSMLCKSEGFKPIFKVPSSVSTFN
jgi:hypothetical protein